MYVTTLIFLCPTSAVGGMLQLSMYVCKLDMEVARTWVAYLCRALVTFSSISQVSDMSLSLVVHVQICHVASVLTNQPLQYNVFPRTCCICMTTFAFHSMYVPACTFSQQNSCLALLKVLFLSSVWCVHDVLFTGICFINQVERIQRHWLEAKDWVEMYGLSAR